MKKTIIITTLILLCTLLFATKITFITSAEASDVKIIGDFTNFIPAEMEQYNGLWKYTTELEEGTTLYKYAIDGQKQLDFNNTQIAIHNGETYNIREIPSFSIAKAGDSTVGKIYFELNRKFINPVEPGEIYLTIGFAEGDVEDVTLQSNSLEIEKEKFTQKKVDYFRFHVKTPATALKYRFLIKDNEAFIYGYNGGEDFFEFDFAQPIITYMNIPEWAKGATIYQIFPDRLKNSNTEIDLPYQPDWYRTPTNLNLSLAHYGGDLQGITDSADYLKNLNVDVVYLNPIFEADSTHKYNTTDYLRIDPAFGTEQDFSTMVDTLHKNGINIILDGVFNHTGTRFFAMQENFAKQEKSNYLDWYFINKFPIEKTAESYKTWQGYASLPKLDTDNPEVRAYITEVLGKWMKHAINGWRLDTAEQYPMRFLSDFFYPTVKSINPDSMIIGEYWKDGSEFFENGCMNSIMNYLFRDAALTYASGGSSKAFANSTKDYLYKYPPQIIDGLWNMLGSHDTPRFLTMLNEDVEDAKLTILLQMTFKGSPVIYYGDELGLTGDGDPFCRQPYPWNDRSQWNMEITELYKKLLNIRATSDALKKGTLNFIVDKAGVLGFEREYGNEKIVVFANSRSRAFNIKYTLDGEYENLLGGETMEYIESVEGKDFMVLRRK